MATINPIGIPHAQVNRRGFLHVGALALASALIPSFLPFEKTTFAADTRKSIPLNESHKLVFTTRDGKDPGISVIIINLQGGLSFFDSFDPKTNSAIKGPFKPIKTSCPEISITEPLEPLSKHMHKFVFLNNLYHTNTMHDESTALIYTGSQEQVSEEFDGDTVYKTPFTLFSEMLLNEGSSDIRYVVLHNTIPVTELRKYHPSQEPKEIIDTDPWTRPFKGADVSHQETMYCPFDKNTGLYANPFPSSIKLDVAHHKRRMQLLEDVENHGHRLAGPSIERHKRIIKKANSLIDGDFNKAFDLSQEPIEVREKYGINPFGNQLLLAKRMIEVGARIVMANDGDYDFHWLLEKNGMIVFPRFAKALSALLDDLEKIDKKVVVAIVTEFGRTSKINDTNGREHWPYGFGALFCGYGIEGGRVIGKVDDKGYVVGDANDARNIAETILNKMGLARCILRNDVVTNERFPLLQI